MIVRAREQVPITRGRARRSLTKILIELVVIAVMLGIGIIAFVSPTNIPSFRPTPARQDFR
jgi:hypothetical protein